MYIIIKNIPINTRLNNIKNFIEPSIKGGLLSKSGRIEAISILKQKNTYSGLIEHHGLVKIMPDFIAKRAIYKLNRKQINNSKNINVNEYHTRSWHNDKRVIVSHLDRHSGKRSCDRRSKHLEIEEEVLHQFDLSWTLRALS